MRNFNVPIFVACLCIVVAVSNSPAWEFKLPNLNPFAKRQSPPQSRFHQPTPKKSFLPKISLFPKRTDGRPSTLQKINRSTVDFLVKTRDALTPWNRTTEMPPQRPHFSGSRRTYSGSPSMGRRAEPERKTNWLARLNPFSSGRSNEPEPIDDVNDFFRMPRPRY